MVGLSTTDEDRRQRRELVALPRRDRERIVKLPAPLTRFIGRGNESAAVVALLRGDGVRLVTLTGPGGVGKSRLALRAAEDVAGDYADGVAFVSLAPVRSAELVLPTIVQALGVSEGEGRPAPDRLAAFLHDREFLLLLDNFEQVVDAGPALVDLLQNCPHLTALVTSRAPLRLSGEHVFPVPPLALPPRGAGGSGKMQLPPAKTLQNVEAIQLFVDRAQTAFAGFALTAENAPAVAAICERTDGLPLAIELAAARTRALSPADLLARLSPRLPVLTGGPRDQPHRLRTMADAIAWSYDLLESEERALFRRLGVFVGGFTLEAAEAVTADGFQVSAKASGAQSPTPDTRHPTPDTLDALTTLVDESLVQHGAGPAGETRYTMLETVREYALDRLHAAGEERAVRDAHADWCIACAERAAPELAGPDHVAWFNRLEAEIGNIRAADAWLLARGDAQRALRLGVALSWFWQAAGYLQEGQVFYTRLLEMPNAASFPPAFAGVLGTAGSIAHHLGDLERAQHLIERALRIAQERGDERAAIGGIRSLGSIAVDRDDLETAERLLSDVAARGPVHGAEWEAVSAQLLLGTVAFTRGDYETAMRHAESARARWLEQGDTGHAGLAQAACARAAFAAGNARRAAVLGHDVLSQLQDVEDDLITADCFELAAGLAWASGNGARASRLLAAAEVMRVRIEAPRRAGYQVWFEQLAETLRHGLGEQTFVRHWGAGTTLSLNDATAAAFAVFDRAAGPSARARTASTSILTPRERDVLRLLVDGLSDKEIAAALGISRFTASNHVTAIRDKLGAPSRAAAVALALRDELV